jgi:hypothetical protein
LNFSHTPGNGTRMTFVGEDSYRPSPELSRQLMPLK